MGANSQLVFNTKNWADESDLGFVIKLICSADIQPKRFSFGSIDGIYNQTQDGKDIIAIYNAEPHNGEFEKFICALEKYAQDTGERIAICSFFNERLYWHLRKRKGWGNELSTMDRLEYYAHN